MYECRSCKSAQFTYHVGSFSGFPSSAQGFTFSSYKNDSGVDINVFGCISCDLIQISGAPVSYYKDVITAATLSDVQIALATKELTEFFGSFSGALTEILEVGSGKGAFLDVLRTVSSSFGYSYRGIENGNENFLHCKSLGHNVFHGTVIDYEASENKLKYDAIFVNNFLEHQPEPILFLKAISKLCHSKSALYLSVPNFERMVSSGCMHEFIPDHLLYFTKKSLENVLSKSGFQVFRSYFKNNDNDIVVYARLKSQVDLTRALQKYEAIVSSVSRKLAEMEGKRVAIWGAGHRALALMSAAGAHNISCVIDSAPFKQGKQTPVLGHRVVGPELALNSGLDCVILMLPADYNSEAFKFLIENDFRGEIIDFRDQPI